MTQVDRAAARLMTEGDPRDEIVLHLPALRAFALSLTRNSASADDLVQDTIVKAWTNFHGFQPGTNLRAWLLAILRNTFFSNLRSRKSETNHAGRRDETEYYVRPAHDGTLAMRDFLRAFEELSAEHREALTLIGALGLSYDEAALALGVRVGTVKSRVARARSRLVEILQLGKNETIMPDPDNILSGLMPQSQSDKG
ncbi:MAG: sigma-70 family RNA polymerase sigma factor [Gemmobacter sp.]|nr:sigma-70 family RNA polymerase sigma factor [Gemmobacter sp.]